ncbi:MAG: hypothetical protein ABIP03_02375 [Aquihabitans sp.]
MVAAAGVALLMGGMAACGAGKTTAAGSSSPPPEVTVPGGSATTLVTTAECRVEMAPMGTDAYGVRHTGEKLCTWGADMRSRLDSRGFLVPSQNHPVDLETASRCWSASGRLYLRTPASGGWACIGGTPDSTIPPAAPVATTPTTPPVLSASSTLTLRGLGPVRIGMTVAEASAAAGTTLVQKGVPGESCAYGIPEGGPEGVAFMFLSGRLARVDVNSPGIKTLSGAAVGDSEAAVQALYAGQLQVSPHKYVPAGSYLTLVPADAADAELRLIFETDGSKVTRFRAGSQPGVSYIEGCS